MWRYPCGSEGVIADICKDILSCFWYILPCPNSYEHRTSYLHSTDTYLTLSKLLGAQNIIFAAYRHISYAFQTLSTEHHICSLQTYLTLSTEHHICSLQTHILLCPNPAFGQNIIFAVYRHKTIYCSVQMLEVTFHQPSKTGKYITYDLSKKDNCTIVME